jgi:glycosyltransferase involved in cell wall biosynthesis
MKKVLIITYYWPPSGGSGVQRWLKFSKYLPENGWEPIIYTPENPESPEHDDSLSNDVRKDIAVVKRPIFEPYSFYKRFIGKKQTERISVGFLSESKKPKLREKIAVWIRGNLFIPDARKFWIKPSVKFLTEYLKENPVDAIISTGPPHSMHLIALGIKSELNIPWIADFRDPWTNIDFYSGLMLTRWADRKHRLLEKKVLQNADTVVSVGKSWAKELGELGDRNVEVITNGFDPEDFRPNKIEVGEKFSITHIGSMNKDRNHPLFWETLSHMANSDKSFAEKLEIRLVGKNDISVCENIEKFGLSEYVVITEYVPHKEIEDYLRSSAILYLPVNNTPNALGILTGKVFEYLHSGRPILAIGPENGDLAEIISKTKHSRISGFESADKLRNNIQYYFNLFKEGNLKSTVDNIDIFSRRELTKKYASLLNNLTDSAL